MSTETIKKNELTIVVEQSGIEKSKGELISNTLSTFFSKANEWNDTIEALTINDVTEVGKMKMAREGRLTLKNMRLEAKKLVDNRRGEVKAKMADYVLEDKLWLKGYQMVEATFKNLETKLEEKEKYAEIKEMERLHELEKERINLLMPFNEFCSIENMDLKTMSEEEFTGQLEKAKRLFDLDAAEKNRIEEGRIAKEKAEAEERERIRLENERLKKEAEEKAKAEEKLRLTRSKRSKELQPYIQFIRKYDELISKEEGEYKKQFAEIKKGAEDHWEFERKEQLRIQKENEEAEKRRKKALAEQEAKLKKEREAKAKIEAELLAKKEAEKRAAEKALKAKNEAEESARKAALAPQKEKITKWVNTFEIPDFNRDGLDDAANEKVDSIIAKFNLFKEWAEKEIKSIK